MSETMSAAIASRAPDRRGLVEPPAARQHLVATVRRNSGSVVVDGDDAAVPIHDGGRERDPLAGPSEGVVDQRAQHFLQIFAIGRRAEPWIDRDHGRHLARRLGGATPPGPHPPRRRGAAWRAGNPGGARERRKRRSTWRRICSPALVIAVSSAVPPGPARNMIKASGVLIA